eukprot:4825925-Pleurochrysis_carterae.AAC.3
MITRRCGSAGDTGVSAAVAVAGRMAVRVLCACILTSDSTDRQDSALTGGNGAGNCCVPVCPASLLHDASDNCGGGKEAERASSIVAFSPATSGEQGG